MLAIGKIIAAFLVKEHARNAEQNTQWFTNPECVGVVIPKRSTRAFETEAVSARTRRE
jgi:hypothetical protein